MRKNWNTILGVLIVLLSWAVELIRDVRLAWRIGVTPAAGGASYTVSVAAATAVLGYNMLTNQTWVSSGRTRRINSVAVTGSAAAGDAGVDVFVGSIKVASLYNGATGVPTKDHHMSLNAIVPAGELISCIVIDAPATNPLFVQFEIIG